MSNLVGNFVERAEAWRQLKDYIDSLDHEIEGFPLNCQPSPPDPRDYKVEMLMQALNVTEEPLPEEFTSEPNLPPVFDQGQRGTCVAASLTWSLKAQHEVAQGDWPADGLSAAYLYTRCKQIDGIPNEEGTYISVGLKVLQQYGVCTEAKLPYSKILSLPAPKVPSITSDMDAEATRFKIGNYAQICSNTDKKREPAIIDVIKRAIYNFKVVPGAVFVCENFNNYGKDYIIPLPEGRMLGLHAIALVGWSDKKRAFRMRNSWGKKWGDNGYAWLPYEWFLKGTDWTGYGHILWYFLEAWTATDVVIVNDAKVIELTPYNTRAKVDGTDYYLDQPPIVDPTTNRMLVPIRFVSNHMGRSVEWDGTKAIIRKLN